MNRYLKLVNFEFSRFLRLYLILIGITTVSQLLGVIVESRNYVKRINESINIEFLPKDIFIDQMGTISFLGISNTIWFLGSIALCVVTLLIYVFFIWYRDWLGKNTFAYRLLMLPIARLQIYLAKATTIVLCVLGLVALQLLLLPIENLLFQQMVPNDFRTNSSIFEVLTNNELFSIMIPISFIDFTLYYCIGITAVFIIFTAILFERAYRLKGIIYGILFTILSLVIIFAPVLIDAFILTNYFYPIELFIMNLGSGLIGLAFAIWTGNFLIKNKVRV